MVGFVSDVGFACRRVCYAVLSFGVLLAALGGSIALYFVAPTCTLNTFFISQTIALGMGYTVLSGKSVYGVGTCSVVDRLTPVPAPASAKVGKGLLPPSIMFAYVRAVATLSATEHYVARAPYPRRAYVQA